MRLSIFAITIGLAGTSLGQFNGVPTCGQPCLTKYTSGGNIAGCNSLDVACICSNQNFLSDVACCLSVNCDPADQQEATNFADSLCKANGVTVPTAVVCTSTPAATGSSTTSPSASSTGSQSSSSAANAATISSTTTSTHSSTPSSTPSSTSSSATTKSTSNAGSLNAAGIGAGIMVGLAAAAALL